MPRPTRVHIDGALCLVTCRAMEGTVLFQEPRDYETYLALLQEYRERYGFKLFAYALLPDHLALCLEPANGTTVSTFMHALNSRYTKYVIKRHSRTGHVFQERFKLTLLEKAPWLLRITGYLHTHPRRCGVSNDVEGYRWSSCPSYLAAGASDIRYPLKGSGQMVSDIGRRSGEVAEVFEALSQARPGCTYVLYLQSVPEAEWDAMRIDLERPALGSPAFLALVERQRRRSPLIYTPIPADTADSNETLSQRRVPESIVPGRSRPLAMTLSLAMAFVALVAALLSARTVDFLRQTLKVLAEENTQTLLALSTARTPASPVQLASLQVPEWLSRTSWQIQLQPMVGSEAAEAVTDQLQFEGEQIRSIRLSAEGFASSNYSLALQPGGTVQWGTMQTSATGEIVCWRGAWDGRVMRGVMTRERPGSSVVNYSFVGTPQMRETGSTTTSEA